MIVETSTLSTTASFCDSRIHRYSLTKIWSEKLPIAMVLMLNPSSSDETNCDLSTTLTVNNLCKLGFGGSVIVNLFSNRQIPPKCAGGNPDLTDEQNDKTIASHASNVDKVILAYGSGCLTYKHIKARQDEVLELLKPYKSKLYTIQSKHCEGDFHPLAPQVRSEWRLAKYKPPKKINTPLPDKDKNHD